ncbi:MAG: S1 RNA-binding domain-containing protein [Lawsonibacter sp.]
MEFGVGSILDGKVTGITKFGAFVALPEGKSGLVHISEIAYSYVNEVSDHLHEGQEVKVKVIGIDQANRINLSIKQVAPPPQRPAYPAGGGAQQRSGGPQRPGGPQRTGGGRPHPQGGSWSSGSVRQAPKEPTDFEDRLKQFMQSSDNKLSELRYIEKKGGNRRGGGRK